MVILQAKNLRKVYGSGESEVAALDGVNLSVEKGEFLAIVGTSGSGKSTLLNLLGGDRAFVAGFHDPVLKFCLIKNFSGAITFDDGNGDHIHPFICGKTLAAFFADSAAANHGIIVLRPGINYLRIRKITKRTFHAQSSSCVSQFLWFLV